MSMVSAAEMRAMWSETKKWLWPSLWWGLLAGCFLLDLLTPRGYTVPLLYGFLLVAAVVAGFQWNTYRVSAGLIALSWFGFFSDQSGDASAALFNRMLATIGLVTTAIAIERYRPLRALAASQRLLKAITRVQSLFIDESKPEAVFDVMLQDLLQLTNSQYGFIGEVLWSEDRVPRLRTHVMTHIAWNDETKAVLSRLSSNLEFMNLDALFRAVMTTAQPVIANDPANDPRTHGLPPGHPPMQAFLGLPFFRGHTLTGMVGIANRPGGYDQALIAYLQPYLCTCTQLVEGYRSRWVRDEAESELRVTQAELERRVTKRTAELMAANASLELEVADRKGKEQALGESHRLLRQVIDINPHFIFAKDRDGRFTLANRAVADCYGTTTDELIGRTDSDFNHDAQQVEQFRAGDRWVTETGQELVIDEELITDARGRRRWLHTVKRPILDQRGLVVQVLGTSIDITQRKRTEDTLMELTLAQSHAMPGIARLDLEGRYVTVNDAYAAMVGYLPDAMIGMSWEPTVHAEDRSLAQAAYARMVAEGIGEFEARAVRTDGSLYYKQVLMVKRVEHDGRFVGHHCFMKDISERKRAERTLAQAEESRRRQEVAERLLQEREVVSRNLHDGVLQSIYAVKLGLERGQRLLKLHPEQMERHLEQQIRDASMAIAEMRRFLEGEDPLWAKPTDLREGLEGLVDLYRATSTIEWELRWAHEEAVRPALSNEVVRNLLYVVREAMSNVARHASATQCRVSVLGDAGDLQLKVEDNGVGFRTNRGRRKGRGLSNMQVRARHIGAVLDIAAAPGAGTCVTIELLRRETHVTI